MKAHPTEIRCLIELDPEEKKTRGGIILPDNAVDRKGQRYATLLEVGGNAFEGWEPPIPRPGDRVVVSRYEAHPVTDREDERIHLINDKAIGAILSESSMEDLKRRDNDVGYG